MLSTLKRKAGDLKFLCFRDRLVWTVQFSWQQTSFDISKFCPKTIDPSIKRLGITIEIVGFFSLEPRAEVYYVMLNFNISKLVYCLG